MNRLTRHYKCEVSNKILEALGINNLSKEDIQIIKCDNELCSETCKRVEHCEECPIQEAIAKLAEYEDAEEKGLLLRLPCHVGDSVYRINPGATDPIIEMMVQTIAIRHHATSGKSVCLFCNDLKDLNESHYLEKAFGNDVFFTIEEAEAALKKIQEGEE